MNYEEMVKVAIDVLMLVMEMIVAGGLICSLVARPGEAEMVAVETPVKEPEVEVSPEEPTTEEEIEMDVAEVIVVEKLNYRQLRTELKARGISYGKLNKAEMVEALKSCSAEASRQLPAAA